MGQARLLGEYFFAAGVAALDGGGDVLIGNAGQSSTDSYDTLGRKHTVTDDSGQTTYSYDPDGNIIEEDTPEGVIHYKFDLGTDRHTETFTDNTDIIYARE